MNPKLDHCAREDVPWRKCRRFIAGLAWFLGGLQAILAQLAITTQPTSQTVNQGFPATFQLRATGLEPLVYKWFFDSIPIPGVATNTLSITNAVPDGTGDYFAVVSDPTP